MIEIIIISFILIIFIFIGYKMKKSGNFLKVNIIKMDKENPECQQQLLDLKRLRILGE